jgi:hypothetical protein
VGPLYQPQMIDKRRVIGGIISDRRKLKYSKKNLPL